MEALLLKMARQLNALDEASLMVLWDKYMARVQNFDGSKQWEESAIVFSLIQAVHAKNNLFNAHLDLMREHAGLHRPEESERKIPRQTQVPKATPKKGKIIPFRPLD